MRPDVSFILPVFEKADVLPAVVRALAAQRFDGVAEYVFVDDASTDGSAAVLRAAADRLPNVRVLENARNAGPSVRLNQGAAVAEGRFFCLIDADELIAPDGLAAMLRLLANDGADFAHGKVAKTDLAANEIVPAPVGEAPDHEASDAPLKTILGGRGFVRMAWLVDADLYRAAGGADEAIFIQDESLPLRLAAKARRFVDMRAAMTYAPRGANHLSANRAQQHHDRFLAYYHLLRDNPGLPGGLARTARRKCVSAAWKAAREGGFARSQGAILPAYLAAGLGLGAPDLDGLAAAFAAMPGVRRA